MKDLYIAWHSTQPQGGMSVPPRLLQGVLTIASGVPQPASLTGQNLTGCPA
jgi:hypothetical protein